MAELVDAYDSKSYGRKVMGVQVSPEALSSHSKGVYIMKKIRLVYRLLGSIFIFTSFCVGIFFFCIFIRNKTKRHKKISKLIQFLAKTLMKVLGFTITTEGLEYLKERTNYLIVANHIGYIDILIIHSFIQNNFFISHHEVQKDSVFLGFIVKNAGVYFIERKNLKTLRKELRETTDFLKKGFHIVMFPEGTSTDGSKILPFHPPFFSTAIYAKKPILPVYINYTKVENEHFSLKNRDLICWYDNNINISFKEHFLRLLQLKSVNVNIKFLPPLSSENKTSRVLAIESREQIQKHFIAFD